MKNLPESKNEELSVIPEFKRWKYYAMVVTGYLLLLSSYFLMSNIMSQVLELYNGRYLELPFITQIAIALFFGGSKIGPLILLIIIYGIHVYCLKRWLYRFLFPILLLFISSSILAVSLTIYALIIPLFSLSGKLQ